LVFIVEGESEVSFVHNLIIPYLHERGLKNPMHAQTITTNRKHFSKGGIGSYGKFKNEIERTLAQGNVFVTTMIDYYGLPADFPGLTNSPNQIDAILKSLKESFQNNPDFLPYIQKHEFEALMFSNIKGFEFVHDNQANLELIRNVIQQFPNPEDINNSPITAPSKRLEKIIGYDKMSDGPLILGEIGIIEIISKCKRFAEWLESVINELS